jgi:hypothetical protein
LPSKIPPFVISLIFYLFRRRAQRVYSNTGILEQWNDGREDNGIMEEDK